jgi:hypothetical protein
MPAFKRKALEQEKLAHSVLDPWQQLAESFRRPPKGPFPLMALDERPADLPREEPDFGEARAAMLRVLRNHPDLAYMGFESGASGPDP